MARQRVQDVDARLRWTEASALIEASGLSVTFTTARGEVHAVRNVDLLIRRGECRAIVGESGSGKSTVCRALLRLEAPNALVTADRLNVCDHGMLGADETSLNAVRGSRAGLVLQDPVESLNPYLTVEGQLTDVLSYHGTGRQESGARAAALLRRVSLEPTPRLLRSFPHELSGGMCQRVAIALALAPEPDLLIADEPTSSLDPTTQDEILSLLDSLRRLSGLTMILVTHDLGVAARLANTVTILYAGRVMEDGPAATVMKEPHHHYTAGLLAAVPDLDREAEILTPIPGPHTPNPEASGCAFAPRCGARSERCTTEEPGLLSRSVAHTVRCFHPVVANMTGESERATIAARSTTPRTVAPAKRGDTAPVLRATNLGVSYPVVRGAVVPHVVSTVDALEDLSFTLGEGEVLGVVGETGSGKTTLIRACMGHIREATGTVELDGHEILGLTEDERRQFQRRMQIVYQNPRNSLDPLYRAVISAREPLDVLRSSQLRRSAGRTRGERYRRAVASLNEMGLDISAAHRAPDQLSGGQQQRTAIGRATVNPPRILFADEPVSALDVSVQATVINLLRRLAVDHGIAMVFVSHDLGVIRAVADTVLVLRTGRVVEYQDAESFFDSPTSDYGRLILSSARANSLSGAGRHVQA